MNSHIIKAKQVTKVFQSNGNEVHALRGVDLAIKAGEFVAVMGPSGCGKSTLLHILGGLDNPTSGEVYLEEQRLDQLNEAKRALLRRKKIGFVFQAFNLIANLSVGDNVELPSLISGIPFREARQTSQRLLDTLGVGDKYKNLPGQLSGGQMQRVALARALANKPAILLADEPTGNLDSKTMFEVLGLLRQAHEQGQTILLVTHDPNVASIAQRVVFMRDGLITGETELTSGSSAKELLVGIIDMEA